MSASDISLYLPLPGLESIEKARKCLNGDRVWAERAGFDAEAIEQRLDLFEQRDLA